MPFQYHNGNPPIPPRMVDGVGFGRIAIITGCASGIGLATTQLFLSHQYQVLGVDGQEMDYTMIDSQHQERFHFHRADLTQEGECDEAVRISVAEYGPKIDILINTANTSTTSTPSTRTDASTCSDSQWKQIIATNLTVPMRLIRSVVPLMRAKNHGAIINIASDSALDTGEGVEVAYTTAKAGLVGLTKSTASRLRGDGIRCNVILPGAIDSSLAPRMERDLYRDSIPTHKGSSQKPSIRAVDIANSILFLASDQAAIINGVSLPVDQAWSTS